MKIIGTDNFSRDTVSDFLVCSNVNEYYGKLIVDRALFLYNDGD